MAGVRFQTEDKDFSSLHKVQIGSGDHPASYPVDTGPLSQRLKRPGPLFFIYTSTLLYVFRE
jgi:hypothetical protein